MSPTWHSPSTDPNQGLAGERARCKLEAMSTLTAIIYPDDDGDWLVAQNPETGTTTQGRTYEEALANLKEATELYLSEFPLPHRKPAMLTTFEVQVANA
jgi:predicted RNase H-like HicB family nuclease